MNRLEGLRKKVREQSHAPRSDRLGCISQVKIGPYIPSRNILPFSPSLSLLRATKRDTESSKRVARREERGRRRVENKARGKKKRREEVLEGIGAKEGEKKRCWKEKEEGGREKTASANVTGLHSDVGV